MEIGARARRKKSHFRPWNSFIGKKQTADAAAFAEQRASDVPAIRKLTVGLIETYEAINAAYYEKKRRDGRAARRLPRDQSDDSRTATAANAAADAARRRSDETAVSTALVGAVISDPSEAESQTHLTTVGSDTEAPDKNEGMGGGDGGGGGGKPNSPHSVQYCDENHDYIVHTGDMFNNRYMLEKVIGRGSFGQVVRAYDTRENSHVAIKIIKNSALYVEQALSEVRMTSYLNRIDPDDAHAIMRLRDKFIFRGHQCLVLELLSFSLYDLLRSTEFFGVSLNLVRKFCRQILNCLAFLARPDVNIAHCDLKPENVLLRHPQRSAIKVVDFGASCRVSESMFTYVQSRFYRAPEVILGLPYDTQVDVWSLGCMLIELHTGYPLFAGRNEGDQISIIVERIGMPPKHMLDAGRKTALFFDLDQDTGEWTLKDNISRKEERIEPGSKPVQSFVDDLTGAAQGKRKRAAGGHSEVDYDIFLTLTAEMLEYDPRVRITAEEALRNPFVTGASMSEMPPRNGRDSPPCLPPLDAAVSESVPDKLEPGRKAPVQRNVRSGVRFDVDDDEVPHSASSNMGAGASADFGGSLRLSKSEPNFDQVTTVQDFVFHASEWAEEVGIEPPPWRAGGAKRAGARLPMLGDPNDEAPIMALGPAGGGAGGRPRRRPPVRILGIRTPVLVEPGPRTDARQSRPRASEGFVLGTSRAAVQSALRNSQLERMAIFQSGRPAPLKVGGHGSALLLRRRRCDDMRLALANSTQGALFFS